MTYTSFSFYIFLLIVVLLYYIIPKTYRWLALLLANFCFIFLATKSVKKMIFFLLTIAVSYAFSLLLEKKKTKLMLAAGIIVSASPLLLNRILAFTGDGFNTIKSSLILPLGLAFYTMQIIAYLSDIYQGKIQPQKNFLKYALFISFFPQIIQGPIPRYEQLSEQLVEGHSFSEKNLMRGIQLIIWGIFLKFLIADKAGVIVDNIFNNHDFYDGLYIFIAGTLYSLQLYADFLGCVTLSQGIAGIFGIELVDNFKHPYFADSIKDFWRRWHISLSSWLRDYVYIPLGGNRKGTVRKYVNLMLTFLVSGFWHGGGFKFIFWGFMHGFYQLVESIVPVFGKKYTGAAKLVRTWVNFFFVMLAWIIFRADGLKIGLEMIYSMFTAFNPWILFDGSLFNLGLVQMECEVLAVSILVLYVVSKKQEQGIVLRDEFEKFPTLIRWAIYILALVIIWVMGNYGYGYNASDFIYGGF